MTIFDQIRDLCTELHERSDEVEAEGTTLILGYANKDMKGGFGIWGSGGNIAAVLEEIISHMENSIDDFDDCDEVFS